MSRRKTRADVPSRIKAHQADTVRRTRTSPGWTICRQGNGDSWLEHEPCGRTFHRGINRATHEKLCTA